jgi:hypothetical protein
MKQENQVINLTNEDDVAPNQTTVTIDAEKISNVVLKRLIEEVQFENQNNILAYNRTHSRHNRGR